MGNFRGGDFVNVNPELLARRRRDVDNWIKELTDDEIAEILVLAATAGLGFKKEFSLICSIAAVELHQILSDRELARKEDF